MMFKGKEHKNDNTTPRNSTTSETRMHVAAEPLLLLRSNRQLFRPSNVPVLQIKLFIEVLLRCDGRGVVGGGTFRSEVLPSQNSGESEMPIGAHKWRPTALSPRCGCVNQLWIRTI